MRRSRAQLRPPSGALEAAGGRVLPGPRAAFDGLCTTAQGWAGPLLCGLLSLSAVPGAAAADDVGDGFRASLEAPEAGGELTSAELAQADPSNRAWGQSMFWSPEGCPDHATWVQRVEARLDPGFTPQFPVAVEVEVEDVRDEATRGSARGGYLGHLRLRQSGRQGSLLVRDYRASDCELLVDALALAVALVIDPDAADRGDADGPELGPVKAGYLRLDGRVELGIKPSFGGGPGLVVGLIRRAWRSELRVGFDVSRWILDEERLAANAIAAIRPSLGVLTVRLCRDLLPKTAVLDLPLCGGVELGLLSTRILTDNAPGSAGGSQAGRWSFWSTGELGVSLQWQLPGLRRVQKGREERPRWFLSFELATVIPFVRVGRYVEATPDSDDRASLDVGYANEDENKSLYTTGAVGARAGLGVEMRFQ